MIEEPGPLLSEHWLPDDDVERPTCEECGDVEAAVGYVLCTDCLELLHP